MAVDIASITLLTIAEFLLVKLCIFHAYLSKIGLTTYELILKARNKGKVSPADNYDSKLSPLFKKNLRSPADVEIDDSKDIMNASLGVAPEEDQLGRSKDSRGDTEMQGKGNLAKDGEKEAEENVKDHEVDTKANSKINMMANALDQGKSKKPLDPLKEDEGSFVLSKPIKDQADTTEQKLVSPTAIKGDEATPEDWTLRQSKEKSVEIS